MSGEVPSSYRSRIASVEDELGRDICGYPDDERNPCRQWPVDDQGRCHGHAGRSLDEAFADPPDPTPRPSPIQSAPSETIPGDAVPVSPNRDPKSRWEILASSVTYWGMLVCLGLLAGSVSGAFFFGGVPESRGSISEESSLDVASPDFTKIREYYRNGNLAEVESTLLNIYRDSPNANDRAEALYYRYVLEQKRGNHREALDLADRFLNEFENHPLRAEVTFGAWFLADRFLEREDLAEEYKEQLNSEFSDSKWAQKADS